MSRSGIHYWKCDRASAFHGIRGGRDREAVRAALETELRERLWPGGFELRPFESQGNHLIWSVSAPEGEFLVRVEDGPERDDYQRIESHLLDRVREAGVPAPRVAGGDASRSRTPFAWQAIERLPYPDLRHWHARGELDWDSVAPAIGGAVALWQGVEVAGFGPFRTDWFSRTGELRGHRARYRDYFVARLEAHLELLRRADFLSAAESRRIDAALRGQEDLLERDRAVLVHKDLALWNILGAPDRIAAFIDFDDAVAGDPLDDLSLLACFHPREVLDLALEGYRAVRPLPGDWEARLRLHTLRNLVVKSVIRVGAGYFERDGSHFLIGRGSSGAAFRAETRARLFEALEAMEEVGA